MIKNGKKKSSSVNALWVARERGGLLRMGVTSLGSTLYNDRVVMIAIVKHVYTLPVRSECLGAPKNALIRTDDATAAIVSFFEDAYTHFLDLHEDRDLERTSPKIGIRQAFGILSHVHLRFQVHPFAYRFAG